MQKHVVIYMSNKYQTTSRYCVIGVQWDYNSCERDTGMCKWSALFLLEHAQNFDFGNSF